MTGFKLTDLFTPQQLAAEFIKQEQEIAALAAEVVRLTRVANHDRELYCTLHAKIARLICVENIEPDDTKKGGAE